MCKPSVPQSLTRSDLLPDLLQRKTSPLLLLLFLLADMSLTNPCVLIVCLLLSRVPREPDQRRGRGVIFLTDGLPSLSLLLTYVFDLGVIPWQSNEERIHAPNKLNMRIIV